MSDKLKTAFYEQQNYFEKMMGIMLEWYHLLIGMQTTVLNIVLEVSVVLFFDCMLSSFRFIVHVELRFIKHNILITVINIFIMFNMLLNAGISNLLGSSAGGIKNTFPNNH